MSRGFWKVGELARRSGVSVRTLHWYDEIGLLCPTFHTESGHRLYGPKEVVRLQQVKSLQALGFSLEEVRDCLTREEFSPLHVIRLHLARLKEQMELQRTVCRKLEAIAAHLEAAEEVSAEEFLQTVEAITMMEKYYTPEQMEKIKKQGELYGPEKIKEVQEEWPRLIAGVRAEMDRGTDPADPVVQGYARRWAELVNMFTGGDPGVAASVRRLYEENPEVGERMGIDKAMHDYVSKGMAAAGVTLP